MPFSGTNIYSQHQGSNRPKESYIQVQLGIPMGFIRLTYTHMSDRNMDDSKKTASW